MTTAEFAAAIRSANGLSSDALKPGGSITIPGLESQPLMEKSRLMPRDGEVRAIYLTGTMAGSEKGMQILRRWKQVGGNAVVFDIKDSDGILQTPFSHPLAPKRTHFSITNLPKFVRFVHSLEMHAIARIALFRDERLVLDHPELAVQSRRAGGAWRENGKLVWTDPSQPAVQEYNLALARHVAMSGVDEVQFDYVRFPAEGDQKDAQFVFEKWPPRKTPTAAKPEDAGWKRSNVLADFLARAYGELHPTGVLMSLDVFGVMAWQRSVDLSHTGQDIVQMAKHCDVLSPMIYPSHFFGMDGIAHPGDAPEHFISESMDRFRLITAGSGVVLRPWLQAFAWRTKTYSPEYIRIQVSVARNRGGIGFLFWNARNDYSRPFEAMPTMMAEPGKYFGHIKAETASAAETEGFNHHSPVASRQ